VQLRENIAVPNDKPEPGKQPEVDQNAALLRMLKETSVNSRDDYLKQRPVVIDAKECFRCHPKREEPRLPDLTLYGFGSGNRRDDLLDFARGMETPAAREAREAKKFQSENNLDKSVHLAARLPENLRLEFSNKGAGLQTDFVKLAKVVPGVEMDKTTTDVLSSIKSARVADSTASVLFNREAKLPVGKDVPLLGKVSDISLGAAGELKFKTTIDAQSKAVALTDIEGMNLKIEGGKDVAIRGISTRMVENKPTISVTIDNPKERNPNIPEAFWPKTITVPLPLDKVAPGLDTSALPNVILALADVKQVLQDKDVSRIMGTTGDAGVDGLIKQLASGLTSIEKRGQQITINRDNGNAKLNLGGPDITVAPTVTCTLKGDGDSVKVTNITGLDITIPLPAQLGNRMTTPLQEVSLDSKDWRGNRDLVIRTGRLLEVVRVNVDGNLQPVKDGQGNWGATITMPNLAVKNDLSQKFTFKLKLDANNNINMSASEVASIVGDATWEAADLSLYGAASVITSGLSKGASGVLSLFGY
jgi:hypothetical protein